MGLALVTEPKPQLSHKPTILRACRHLVKAYGIKPCFSQWGHNPSASDAGLTASDAGLTASDAGLTASDAGLTASDAGLTASDAGLTASDAGLTASDAGLTMRG